MHCFIRRFCIISALVPAFTFAGGITAPQVLVVGMGKKNPTFNESKFPDLTFVYLADAKSKASMNETGKAIMGAAGGIEQFEGEPADIVKHWNEAYSATWGDATNSPYKAVLIDGAGNGAWQGCINSDSPLESEGEGDEETLEDALKVYVKKAEMVKVEKKDKIDYSDKDVFIGLPFLQFDVTDVNGEKKPVSTWTKNGKPLLVIFLRIPEGIDLSNPEEAVKKAKSAGEKWKAIAVDVFKEKTEELFKNLEEEFWGKKIK